MRQLFLTNGVKVQVSYFDLLQVLISVCPETNKFELKRGTTAIRFLGY